jgi:predicted Zn-dependent protease
MTRFGAMAALALVLGVAACGDAGIVDGPQGGVGTRRDLATTDEVLRDVFGVVPGLPRIDEGRMASWYARAKGWTRVGAGKLSHLAGEPPTEPELVRMGNATAAQMRMRFPPARDPALDARMQRILGRLLAQRPRASPQTYRFEILRAPQPNAFMGPGGRGFVLSGLATLLARDDALAFVLAHEVAHGELRHPDEAVHKALAGWKLGEKVREKLDGRMNSDQAPQMLAELARRILTCVYDQDLEFEADRLGLALMIQAGYDPSGAVEALNVLTAAGAEPQPEGLQRIAYDVVQTHPPTPARIVYVRQLTGLNRAR